MSSNLPISLYLLPFFAALTIGIIGLFIRGSARFISLATLAALTCLSLYTAKRVFSEGVMRTELGGWLPPLGIELVLDPLAACMAVLVSTSSFFLLLGSAESIRQELPGRQSLLYATSLLLIAGLIGLILAGDLFNLFVHLEVASLSACALVACGGPGAPRAGLRYLVLGSLGASLYLLGVGFLYAAVGSMNIADISQRLLTEEPHPRLVLISAVLIVVGLSVKMGLFPLHGWMPAAYSRSPLVAAALMAPLVTKVSAFALFRVLYFVFGPAYLATEFVISEALVWGGCGAVVFGGLLALKQKNIRRLLAYSSVAQIGIVAVGFGLVSINGLVGSLLHIANDTLMKAALFLAASVMLLRYQIVDVSQLCRLRGHAPWLSGVVVIAGLSLIGIPPLAGFFGKWYVLSAAIEDERWVVVLSLILGSLATVAYVFRMLEQIYFSPVPDERFTTTKSAYGEFAVALLFAVGIIAFGLLSVRIVEGLVLPALSGVSSQL